MIAEGYNLIVNDNCSLYHAEINAIKKAQEKLKAYNLTKHNLSIYISIELCIMYLGAIMWSGIKNIYYSIPSKDVEEIIGFDEGWKPNC